MKYPADQKEAKRVELLELAAEKAKENGFSATGIDSLAKAANVTSGAIYSQFGSKEELFAQLIEREMDHSLSLVKDKSAPEIRERIRQYLSLSHSRNPDIGCVMPALSVEVGRSGPHVRKIFERKIVEMHQEALQVVKDKDDAWALLAQVVGAVILSRAMHKDETKSALLDATLNSANSILRKERNK